MLELQDFGCELVFFFEEIDGLGGDFLVAARISRPEFLEITKQLTMTNQVDLLKRWPEALQSSVPWWNPEQVNDTNTFFAERRSEFSRVVARYQDGMMYLKRDVPKR